MPTEKETKISKNIIFPAKLSFQESYPETSIYTTPEYIKEYRKTKEEQELLRKKIHNEYLDKIELRLTIMKNHLNQGGKITREHCRNLIYLVVQLQMRLE